MRGRRPAGGSRDYDLLVKNPEGVARRVANKIGGGLFALSRERDFWRVVVQGKSAGRGKKAGAERVILDFSEPEGGPSKKEMDLSEESVRLDLLRRDFTVNAVACRLSDFLRRGGRPKWLDPLGGIADLRARRLVPCAADALEKDPVRTIRGYRMAAEFGLRFTPKWRIAIRTFRRNHRRGVLQEFSSRVSAERLRDEFFKLLETKEAGRWLDRMDRDGILGLWFPELDRLRRSGRGLYPDRGVLGHSLRTLCAWEDLRRELGRASGGWERPLAAYLAETVDGFSREVLLKFLCLLHDLGKPATARRQNGQWTFYGHAERGALLAEKLCRRLRLSREQTRWLTRWTDQHMRLGSLSHAMEKDQLTDRAVFRYLRDLGDLAPGMILFGIADHWAYWMDGRGRLKPGRWKDPYLSCARRILKTIFRRPQMARPPRLATGHDVMRILRIPPGPKVGEILRRLAEETAVGKVRTRSQALRWLKKLSRM